MDEELKACPFCGETLRINNARLAVHSRNSECLLRQQPIVVDDKDQVERWNTRATHPAAASVGGGEAVAVVAYIDDGGALYTAKLLEIMSVEPDGCEQLMTVAQHQRILAARVGSAEPECGCCGQTGECDDDCDSRIFGRDAPVLAPAEPCEFHDHDRQACEKYSGQVPCEPSPTSHDAELVALLREAREMIEHGDFRDGHCMCGSAVEAHGFGEGHSPVDAGVYYAGQVMERIAAKLALLEQKP